MQGRPTMAASLCDAGRHRSLSAGTRETWDRETVPLYDGRRPVGEDGLLYSDCRACLSTLGERHTITRRVRCTICRAPVDGARYCSDVCEAGLVNKGGGPLLLQTKNVTILRTYEDATDASQLRQQTADNLL
jgi:hypothetical protein